MEPWKESGNPLISGSLKVHFAGAEQYAHTAVLQEAGVRYGLWTAYSFLAPRFGLDYYGNVPKYQETEWLPRAIIGSFKRSIIDSGIYSLVYGKRTMTVDTRLLNRWYDAYVEFILNNGVTSTCVEFDCQDILGVEEAWNFRERIRRDLPNNRQINVFHTKDGRRGLDRLIEFSDYIGIPVRELNRVTPQTFKRDTVALAEYIKARKPGIDIHLLGCTAEAILRKARFCTSSDSVSWIYKGAYRQAPGGTRIRDDARQYNLRIARVEARLNRLAIKPITAGLVKSLRSKLIAAELYRYHYANICGNQD